MDYGFAPLVSAAVTLTLLYVVIVAAVRSAMLAQYKMIRWFEATGEWLPHTGGWKEAPTDLPGTAGQVD
jgi:hypothetical protein